MAYPALVAEGMMSYRKCDVSRGRLLAISVRVSQLGPVGHLQLFLAYLPLHLP